MIRKTQLKSLTIDEVKQVCGRLTYLPVDPQVYGKLQYMCNKKSAGL